MPKHNSLTFVGIRKLSPLSGVSPELCGLTYCLAKDIPQGRIDDTFAPNHRGIGQLAKTIVERFGDVYKTRITFYEVPKRFYADSGLDSTYYRLSVIERDIIEREIFKALRGENASI